MLVVFFCFVCFSRLGSRKGCCVLCVWFFFVKKKKKRIQLTTITSTVRTVEH